MKRVRFGKLEPVQEAFAAYKADPDFGLAAAGALNPDQQDYSRYSNISRSMVLKFGVAAAWFLILGIGQVRGSGVSLSCRLACTHQGCRSVTPQTLALLA